MSAEIEGMQEIMQPEQRAARKAKAEVKPTGLWPSLIAARASIGAIPKSATNPHFGNKYAPLGAILGEVVPKLAAHGLCLTATTVPGPALSVRIVSETGAAASCDVPLVGMSDMQKVGGAFSYAFRYGVGALLALELEDDDDGNAASTPAPARQAAPAGRVSAARPTSPPQPAKGGGRAALKAVTCPRCNVTGAIIPGKPEFGGGWLCWPKMPGTAGCGAKYDSDPLTWPRTREQLAAAAVDARIEDEPPPIGDDDLPF